MTLNLTENQDVLINDEDDYAFTSDFLDEFHVGDRVLNAHATCGRDFEPEDEDGNVTIRTKPDPDLRVYESEATDGNVVALVMPGAEIVFKAFYVNSDVSGFVGDLLWSIEEDYEGIGKVITKSFAEGYEGLSYNISSVVTDIKQEAE